MLTVDQRRFFVETRGGVYFPIAGAIFWLVLGVAVFYLPERTWCVMVLSVAVVATPIAIILFKKLVSHLALKSPLATLILPALLPVALSLAIGVAAFIQICHWYRSRWSSVWHRIGRRLAGYMKQRYLPCMR